MFPCVFIRCRPALSLWYRVFGFSALRSSGFPSALLPLCTSVPLSLCPSALLFPRSLFLLSLLWRFSFLLSLLTSYPLLSSLYSFFFLPPLALSFSPLAHSPCSLSFRTAPPLSEPDRRAAEIYFAAAFLVVAFLAAGFFAVFASAFTAVLAGDFRAAGSFSTFASALTALLRVVFFFGSGVPALRA